jgi:hypothetical protein
MPASERRKRKRPGPRTVSRVVAVSTIGGISGSGDQRLKEAAGVIRDAARVLAEWSPRVQESISLRIDGRVATISASAPPARPAELRLRHPLFGDRSHWYGPPGHPFLAPAADAKADAAMAKYALKIDDWAHKAGYR